MCHVSRNVVNIKRHMWYFFREGKSYRVYVLVPLLPAFEGDVGGAGSGAMHCILHYQNSSIATLIKKLKDAGVPDPTQFLSFSSLRTWSELCDTPVTELIYIHSKVFLSERLLKV